MDKLDLDKLAEAVARALKQRGIGRSSDTLDATPTLHPSLQQFAELILDKSEGEKPCPYEPGRACDHCSMCNSRGF